MLITDDKTWNLEEFEAKIEGMCNQVRDFKEERVAFWAHSIPEVIFTFFAIWKLGKIACPLSPRLPSAEPALKRLKASLFVPKMPAPKKAQPWSFREEKKATLLFTSGSLGMPKIACHSAGNHLYNALGSNRDLVPLEAGDRWLLSLPLNHVGGIAILFRCYLAKASIVLSKRLEGVTHLSLVPAQLQKWRLPPTTKYVLLGGGPLPQTGGNILPTYGMTEMSSQIVTGNRLHPYAEMKIGQDGEILVRGKTLFQGYEDEPVDLQEGWFATRDLGRWENGKFEVVGRKDNLFISGGENIQPEEIEGVLKRVLSLQEAVVVPVADAEFGMRPVVYLNPYVEIEAVREALLPLLPKFKIPIQSYALPTEEGLKPNRKKLALLSRGMK